MYKKGSKNKTYLTEEQKDPQHHRAEDSQLKPQRVEQPPSPPTTPSGPGSRPPVDSVRIKLPRSTPPAPSCAGPPPRPPPGTGHQGGPGSPEQKLRQDCVQPWPGHHIPEIITYLKESESSKQDIAVPLPQEHVTIIYTTMATCAASTQSSSKKH